MSLSNHFFWMILFLDECTVADPLHPISFSKPCSIMAKHFDFGKLKCLLVNIIVFLHWQNGDNYRNISVLRIK